MAKKHLKKCSASLIIREKQRKQPLDSTSHQSEWLRSKIRVTADAGVDVEKEEHSSIVGRIASLYNHSGRLLFCLWHHIFLFSFVCPSTGERQGQKGGVAG